MISVAIIGAGPYGLSLAAYLRAAGVDFRIFGNVMESWRRGMPPGMLLKSHAWSACLCDPASDFTLQRFCSEQGIDYHDFLIPVSIDAFIGYGETFQQQLVPELTESKLTYINKIPGGFSARFDNGEEILANRIVVAVGVHPFKYIPRELQGLPTDFLSHSGDYGPLEGFEGRRVVVVGSGASAIDIATLLHERGASACIVARAPELRFASAPSSKGPRPHSLQALWRRLTTPNSGIGSGWLLWACANTPWLFHALPGALRRHIVRTQLGPLGGAYMKDRLIGRVPQFLGCELKGASRADGGVQLHIRTAEGVDQTIAADHIIAATGYRVDLERLEFLPPELIADIRTAKGAPVLSRDYEASVPGLYFIGPASADSFGPVARFVYGAVHPSRRLARRFSSKISRRTQFVKAKPALVRLAS